MSESKSEGSQIGDYAPIVSASTDEGLPIVVGGQAANTWALLYAPRIGDRLAAFRPFTSKDLDLAGDRRLLQEIHRIMGGEIRYSEPRTPVIGHVEIQIGKVIRRIEVLRDVKGLRQADLVDAIEVIVDGLRIRVLAPIKVLKAKICNTVTLDQQDRNDVNHVRIMIECVREFIRDILVEAGAGRITQRDAVNLLEELRDTVSSPLAEKAAAMWELTYNPAWPMNDLRNCGMQKLERFVEHRLKTLD
ncbi:MAG: hypothetical protein ABGZ49_05325 [Akkermansiaceae bacterium]